MNVSQADQGCWAGLQSEVGRADRRTVLRETSVSRVSIRESMANRRLLMTRTWLGLRSATSWSRCRVSMSFSMRWDRMLRIWTLLLASKMTKILLDSNSTMLITTSLKSHLNLKKTSASNQLDRQKIINLMYTSKIKERYRQTSKPSSKMSTLSPKWQNSTITSTKRSSNTSNS
jgi:hypothetical protein